MELSGATLLALPNELLGQIMSSLTSFDLFPVCQVCHRLQSVAQPLLCSAIILLQPDYDENMCEVTSQRKVASLRKTFEQNPAYLRQVQIFETDCNDSEHLPNIIRSLPNLDTLILGNEEDGFDTDDYDCNTFFRSASLIVDSATRALSTLRSGV